MLNSFKIHDENAVPGHKQVLLQKGPLSTNPASSSSAIPLKNQKLALAPRKALGDISANKLNARSVASDIENMGPMKPSSHSSDRRPGDLKPVSKAPNLKLTETAIRHQIGPLSKVNSSTQLHDDSEDIDIVSTT